MSRRERNLKFGTENNQVKSTKIQINNYKNEGKTRILTKDLISPVKYSFQRQEIKRSDGYQGTKTYNRRKDSYETKGRAYDIGKISKTYNKNTLQNPIIINERELITLTCKKREKKGDLSENFEYLETKQTTELNRESIVSHVAGDPFYQIIERGKKKLVQTKDNKRPLSVSKNITKNERRKFENFNKYQFDDMSKYRRNVNKDKNDKGMKGMKGMNSKDENEKKIQIKNKKESDNLKKEETIKKNIQKEGQNLKKNECQLSTGSNYNSNPDNYLFSESKYSRTSPQPGKIDLSDVYLATNITPIFLDDNNQQILYSNYNAYNTCPIHGNKTL